MRPIVNTKNHKKDTALTVHVSLFAFPFLSPPHPTLLSLYPASLAASILQVFHSQAL